MDNYNIRQDRPKLSSDEIAQQKDFNGVLNDFHIMKKPFYKNPWFFGVTGMATVGLLIGTTYGFSDNPTALPELAKVMESVPPEVELKKTIYQASIEIPIISTNLLDEEDKSIKKITLKKKEIHDKTSTLKQTSQIKPLVEDKPVLTKNSTEQKPVAVEKKVVVDARLQNHPRINGKIGGQLHLSTLKKGASLYTYSEIPISGFEMHLATEFGAKILSSNDHRLTNEMIEALESVNMNSEIYFEQIKGRVNEERLVSLQPLKYTLVY